MITIGDGKQWTFLGGAWKDAPDSQLVPPDGPDVERIAVMREPTAGDFTARFRFRLRTAAGSARFLFRVQGPRSFYALDIPWCGQQSRARHFWAGFVVADGTPLQRYLSFDMVPGVCAETDRWYEARVQAIGTRLRAWIDGKLLTEVIDDTYRAGHVGVSSIATQTKHAAEFQGLLVEAGAESPGDSSALTAFIDNSGSLKAPSAHWITPCPVTAPRTFQSYSSLIHRDPDETTLYLSYGNPGLVETRRAVVLRSSDGGKQWSAPSPASLQQGFGASYVRTDGTWVCVFANHPFLKAPLYSYTSADRGESWTGPTPLALEGRMPDGWKIGTAWPPVRAHNGDLVMPLISSHGPPDGTTQGAMCTCFVIRSEDDGATWKGPVRCDKHNIYPGEPIDPDTMWHGLAGFLCEVAMAEAEPGVLLGLGRPMRDPYMWQIRSVDGGLSWEPAAPGPFPGYCPSLNRTDPGTLVALTRFPYFAAHVSTDGGRTWTLPIIVDYANWANQRAVTVQGEVVLVTYMGYCIEPGQADSRIVRLRPVGEKLTLDH